MTVVKPYIPYDVVPSDYELPMLKGSQSSRKLSVPQWIVDWDIPMRNVELSSDMREKLVEIYREEGFLFCDDVAQCTDLITQVIHKLLIF